MENIWLFALTVIIYSLIWFFADQKWDKLQWQQRVLRVAFVALLALPINIGGNVFTIAGNATAEKNIFSLFSVYQKAGHYAFTVFGLAYQKAGKNAMTIFGLTYQQTGKDALTIFGITAQQAGRSALMGIGFTCYQSAENEAIIGIGLTGYQSAKVRAYSFISIALYQRVGEKTRAFGAFSSLAKD